MKNSNPIELKKLHFVKDFPNTPGTEVVVKAGTDLYMYKSAIAFSVQYLPKGSHPEANPITVVYDIRRAEKEEVIEVTDITVMEI